LNEYKLLKVNFLKNGAKVLLMFGTYASQQPYHVDNTGSGLKHTLQMANM